MLRNYLRVTLRNIRRQKGYSFINILGLSTGLAAFVLISLFIRNELSYDRHLEKGADLYRVLLSADIMGQSLKTTNTPVPMAATLIDEYPEVVNAVRVDASPRILVTFEDQQYYEDEFYLVDSTFFEMFSVTLLEGDPQTALTKPNTIVVTEAIARKYFGDEPPMGRVLRVDNQTDFEVTGVMRTEKNNTHLQPELLGSFITDDDANSTVWLNNSWNTYVELTHGANASALEAKFPNLVRKYVGPDVQRVLGVTYEEAVESGLRYEFVLEPVQDIYLYSDASDQVGPTGDIRYVYIMSAIALFVLGIACINFMNLSTARASNRAREIGLRKVLGSERSQLIRQFLGESVTMAAISMVIALGFVALFLPVFNAAAHTSLFVDQQALATLLVASVVTGILAGFYPAVLLSGFQPVTVLKGSFVSSSKGSTLRSALVVFQFAISISLLIGTGVVVKQLHFIQNQDLGFDKEQVVVLPIETEEGRSRFESFRDDLIKSPNILNVAAANGLPGPGHIHQNTAFQGDTNNTEDVFIAALAEVTHDYVETLGLRIIAGRDFSRGFTTDAGGYLINEATAREIGLTPEEIVGTPLNQIGGNRDDSDRIGPIVGVFADAHFESLHQAIQPLVLGMRPTMRYIPIRIAADKTSEALAYLEEKWAGFEPGYPFRYYFMDADYQEYYEQEERLGAIYTYFSGLAILIACLGLFGLASFVTTQRTREIGVRKVMGASVPSIVYLLSSEFTKLVLIACIIAFPVGWFAMNSWLQDFAYATDIGWFVFVVSGVTAVLIAWLTVSYQSIRAAVANPVDALRRE